MSSPSRWKLTEDPVFSSPMLQNMRLRYKTGWDIKAAGAIHIPITTTTDVSKYMRVEFSRTCVLYEPRRHSGVSVKLREDQGEGEG